MAEQTRQPESALDAIHNAGAGYCFIVAKVGAGAFKVFARDPNYCSGAFYAWHENEIRPEGAEALARWLADQVRAQIATLESPNAASDERRGAEAEMANVLSGNDRVAEDFDAATALLPYLQHAPDPWGLAEQIACARPWQKPCLRVPQDDEIPF